MKMRMAFVTGLAAGYVMGTKAGTKRYEQIVSMARTLSRNPGVQRLSTEVNKTVSAAGERASSAAQQTVSQAGNQLADQASKARTFVTSIGQHGDGSQETSSPSKSSSDGDTAPVSATWR